MDNLGLMIVKRIRLWCSVAILLVLAACLPQVTFTINPNPAFVGEAVTFDASANYAEAEENGSKIKSAKWSFGDKANKDDFFDNDGDGDEDKNPTKAKGKIVQHTYTTAGTYTVKLKLKDSRGRKAEVTKQLVVTTRSSANLGSLTVNVRESGDVAIAGATVTIGSATGIANAQGSATLNGLAAATDQVVVVSKPGFITQSLRASVAAGNTTTVPVNMRAVAQTLVVGHIDAEQTLIAETLGASISIPQNAFVKPDGTLATGITLVDITPWDVTSSDLNAMLGNGAARDAAGNLTNLISAGMISAEFRLADGTKLQLAPGKTAKIRMDLPYISINGQPLNVGSIIPKWTFNEAQGLWVEEGVGSVVYANNSTSMTGLAVEATVSHFSTWNWDFKFDNPGSVTVQCSNAAGVSVTCDVVADVTLTDGSKFTRSGYVPVGGTTVINMPNGGSITWTAKAGPGVIGTATSGTSGTVNITLAPVTTSNQVQCQLPDATKVACSVTADFTMTDSSVTSYEYSFAVEGGLVETGLPAASISWTAKSTLQNLGTEFRYYEGTATSGTNGNVVITLNTAVSVPVSKYINVACDFDTNAVAATSCNMRVYFYDMEDYDVEVFNGILAKGEVRKIGLPPGMITLDDRLSFYADATWSNIGYYYGGARLDLNTLVSGQTVSVVLVGSAGI